MKKLLAIMGGPRRGQNTERLLDKFLEGLKDSGEDVHIKKIYIRDMNINHCIGCGYCEKTGKCFMNDDMDILYKDFDEADAVVLASPMFFNGVTSYTKTMINRCQIFWSSKYVLKKSSIDRSKKRFGYFISVSGAPEENTDFECAKSVIKFFFRAINTEYRGELFAANTDDIKTWEREELMNKAYEAGENFFKEF